jgi:hypothetical protein
MRAGLPKSEVFVCGGLDVHIGLDKIKRWKLEIFNKGRDTVYWNKRNNLAVYTNRNGQIKSGYRVTKENKIKDYIQRSSKQN